MILWIMPRIMFSGKCEKPPTAETQSAVFLCEAVHAFGRGYGVVQEHGDGHGTNATWDGCDGVRFFADGCVIDVANEAITRFFGFVGYAVDANVDDDCAILYHVCCDGVGMPCHHDEDVCLTGEMPEVARARMA